MTLDKFLNESSGEEPSDGVSGVETDWLPVAQLTLSSGRLWIGDPQFSWAEANEGEGCVTGLPAGDYEVEAKGIDFGGSRFASRIRVYRVGANNLTTGESVGEAETDSGRIGVADQDALKASFDTACGNDVERALEMLDENLEALGEPDKALVGVFVPDPNSVGRLVYLPSGFGDGGGPVMQLLSDGELVGIEHQFIDPTEPF